MGSVWLCILSKSYICLLFTVNFCHSDLPWVEEEEGLLGIREILMVDKRGKNENKSSPHTKSASVLIVMML